MDEGISPSAIEQRILGDCYFLAAVCAVAERPERLSRIFVSKKPNAQGLYCLNMFVTGNWESVFLDDWFTIDTGCGYRTAFSCTKDNQIWLMLLLKAWAKVYGGYLNICGGMPLEPLTDLTGAPGAHFETKSGSLMEHWGTIKNAIKSNYILTCTTPDGPDSKDPGTSLITSHAYSIIGAYDVTSDAGTYRLVTPDDRAKVTDRVLKLRNPWGNNDHTGKW